jgi:hypothetical protein
MRIVLDKSALFGLSGARVRALCAEHEVWMPEVLFYELLTTGNEERALLFAKIGAGENPFHLISNAGYLWGRELASRRPTQPVADSGLQAIRWVFNARLREAGFDPVAQLPDVAAWRAHIQERALGFLERAQAVAAVFFPDLVDLRGGDLPRVRAIQATLGGDSARVREIYADLAAANDEAVPDGFGPNWMGYRLLQAQLLWALDHIARYGAGPGLTPRELENTFCDAEYGAIAAHADCLLTRDRGLADQFRIMAPDVGCEAQW